MKLFKMALLGIVMVVLFEACIFGSKDKGGEDAAVDNQDSTIVADQKPSPIIVDTSVNSDQIAQDGSRRPRPPVVSYDVIDSLIYIRILGSSEGKESYYWIRRNGLLLQAPVFYDGTSSLPFTKQSASSSKNSTAGQISYVLIDSVSIVGTYVYNVQYGKNDSTMSDKSEDFIFEYFKKTRSGSLTLASSQSDRVTVRVSLPDDEIISQVYIERKIGKGGAVSRLDTLITGISKEIYYVDTNYINLDTVIYYRATGMDAISEEWLEPTPWDSITIENKIWSYLPVVDLIDRGDEVEAFLSNPLSFSNKIVYKLYYNTSSSKTGKIELDSYSGDGSFSLSGSIEKAGVYYFWVEATDEWNRQSARSVPVSINYAAAKKGPPIYSISVSSNYLRIQYRPDEDALEYILERTQDTSKTPEVIDTFNAGTSSSSFNDYPKEDGYYYYRLISVLEGDEKSLPGDWEKSSSSFNYSPVYSTLSMSIVNLGDEVVAYVTTSFSSGYSYVFYRTADKNGDDAVAVDTLQYGQVPNLFTNELSDVPPLGTWYYRVIRHNLSSNNSTIYRTNLKKVVFTGKIVGPTITQISINITSIVLYVSKYQDAIAYIIERALVGSTDVVVIDTIAATTTSTFQYSDIPDSKGRWKYRMKAIKDNFTVTEPGPWKEMSSDWSYSASYYTFNATISNKGKLVEGNVARSSSYNYYFYRSAKDDYSDPVPLDTLKYSDFTSKLTDVPPLGIYYYWIERRSTSSSNNIIYRTIPKKIQFTGAPEIIALTKYSSGVRITFAQLDLGDSTEIWGQYNSGLPSGDFTFLAIVGSYPSYYIDTSPSLAGFYHYFLVGRYSGTGRAGFGATKSIYYEP